MHIFANILPRRFHFVTLRPVPQELLNPFLRKLRQTATAEERDAFQRSAARIVVQFMTPSVMATDASHPIGATASAIRRALPDFTEWRLDGAHAAHNLAAASYEEFLMAVLPPGFALGRAGAFIRATRAMLFGGGDESLRTSWELTGRSSNLKEFAAGIRYLQLADVLDLTWMVTGPLELYTVQERIELLARAVVEGQTPRFSSHEEPRYRAALQLRLGTCGSAAAIGGVLAAWPGRPDGVEAAHVRIYLQAWAEARTGSPMPYGTLEFGQDG